PRAGAIGSDEVAEVVDPAGIAVGIELGDQQPSGVLALSAPCSEERLQGELLGPRLAAHVMLAGFDENVEIPDGSEAAGDVSQVGSVAASSPGAESVAEDPPRGPPPPGRDPHRIMVFGIAAGAVVPAL